VARAKVRWNEGSIFLVPLSDGRCAIGQVLNRTPRALNSAICAFYELRVSPGAKVAPEDLDVQRLLSLQFVTTDLLAYGVWPLVGEAPPRHLELMTRLPALERAGYVGAKVIGSAIIREFLEAYDGLRPWDDYADAQYFEKLLVSPDKKPARVVLTRSKA
jgi:hypothetical protein